MLKRFALSKKKEKNPDALRFFEIRNHKEEMRKGIPSITSLYGNVESTFAF